MANLGTKKATRRGRPSSARASRTMRALARETKSGIKAPVARVKRAVKKLRVKEEVSAAKRRARKVVRQRG